MPLVVLLSSTPVPALAAALADECAEALGVAGPCCDDERERGGCNDCAPGCGDCHCCAARNAVPATPEGLADASATALRVGIERAAPELTPPSGGIFRPPRA
jgi:hypothetical protein